MHNRTIAIAACALAAGCSGTGSGNEPTTKPTLAEATAAPTESATDSAGKTGLEAVWAPKLEAAQENATADCQSPSSTECADALDRIMTVVTDLDTAITATGKRYAQSTAQIVKMQDAYMEYSNEGCEGDPAADDPNSNCWGTMTVTVGASSLPMTLITDDLT